MIEHTTVMRDELSEYDLWELEAFHGKTRQEGWDYTWENYPPRFEFADYQPVSREVVRELLRQHLPAIQQAWNADPDAACERHNAHVDEAQRRSEHRALWAVRFANGNVSPCRTEAEARWQHREPSWDVAALLTRDEPGGQWREVAGES